MAVYDVQGELIDGSSERLQLVLEAAYRGGCRPLCMCTSTGVPMYIAKVSGRYVLKRMPNSGQNHHPDCESFDLPGELSGRARLSDGVIGHDDQSGLTSLKLDFSLSKLNVSRSAPEPSGATSAVEANPKKLTLKSLLHCLYEDAGLNRWSPRMKGKRKWGVVYKFLQQAAQKSLVRGAPLSDIMLIPEPFSMERKDSLALDHKRFIGKLKPVGRKTPYGICVGEVKSIENAKFSYKLMIKHLPGVPLYLDGDLFKKLAKTFAPEMALLLEDESVHILAIATFYVSASGNPHVDSMSLMAVDSHWIPFDSPEEREVISIAIDSDRRFIKGLRYNLPGTAVMANLLFSDTGETSTALYIVPAGVGDDYYTELESATKDSGFKSIVYDVNEEDDLVLPAADNIYAMPTEPSQPPLTTYDEPQAYLVEGSASSVDEN
jgi:hypothetical protein